ncbi:MAG: DeoR/GlpR family DNA-binding transcription regulator, partial [Anaerolineae bacterium]
LAALEKQGLLQRVHGGAMILPVVTYERSYEERACQHLAEKERIGYAAAQYIRENDYIILNSGTTVFQVAKHIPRPILEWGNLTVITNSLPIVRVLGHWKGVHLILLGGLYLPAQDILVGPQTLSMLRNFHADKMFLGTDGMTFSHGLTTSNILEAEIDKAMTEIASEIIVVADSSKVGAIGLTSIIPLTKAHKLITDSGVPADFVQALREHGVEVIIV